MDEEDAAEIVQGLRGGVECNKTRTYGTYRKAFQVWPATRGPDPNPKPKPQQEASSDLGRQTDVHLSIHVTCSCSGTSRTGQGR
jgi:hypothetical protein